MDHEHVHRVIILNCLGNWCWPFYLTVQLILKLDDHLNCVTISHTLDSYSLSLVFYFAVVFFL